MTSAPPILEEIWCFQSGLVLHESHPYGGNTSVFGNCKPPTSIIQRKRAGPKGSAPVLLIIRIEKRPNPFALAITNVPCSNPSLSTTLPIRSTAGMRKTRRSGAKRYPSSRAYPQGACFACGDTPPTLRNTSAAKKHLHLLTNGAIYAKPRAP